MSRVVDLERERVEALARTLVPLLRERGSVVVSTAAVEDVERWRRAARRAGRMLGWRTRTGVLADGSRVWATCDDWPMPAGAMADAARQVDELVDSSAPAPSPALEEPRRR